MNGFRNIVIPIAGPPSEQPVLARAAELARRNGGTIKVIDVVEDFPWYTRLVLPDAEELRRLIVKERSEVLDRVAAQYRTIGIEASAEVLTGRRRTEIVRSAIRGGHDLLMKEAEPNPSILLGSTDMYLLRTCPCPVWLFRPEHADRDFTKIVAAVDPAPPPDEAHLLQSSDDLTRKDASLDDKILGLADAVAEEQGAELHVVHAWSAPGEGLLRGEAMLDVDQVDRYVEDSGSAARRALDHLLSRCPDRSGRRVVHLLKGEPADVIAGFAEIGGVDLIVMGTVARSGLPGLLIGNTAEAILQQVHCSVLAVKPDHFAVPAGAVEP